jgi:predicted ATPase
MIYEQLIQKLIICSRTNNLGIIVHHIHQTHHSSDKKAEKKFAPIKSLIDQMKYFHFRDTSETSAIKQHVNIDDNQYLKSDGANLPAYLYMLKKIHPEHYHRIIHYVQMIMPFFDCFILEKEKLNPHKIMLKWKEKKSDLIFYPHQLSDGSLKIMLLVTLLLLPKPEMVPIIILDEPESGVHPDGIEIIASLIQQAAMHSQIIIATQSQDLLDYFETEDVIVVERPELTIETEGEKQKISMTGNDKQTIYTRLHSKHLESWLKDYSLSELWAKNVFGGRP